MIIDKEIQEVKLSPTKKDFYQIWNELLELASNISERWTPTSTNESDPGIVLLKLLTATADKLNYNIDKDILEAYMPSAAQAESMQKLCDMMGYAMKYYRSATTDVTIYLKKDADTYIPSGSLRIPKFTNVQNSDGSVNYLTLEAVTFQNNITSNTVECIEGTLNFCAEENDKIVTIDNIDDSFRYYLPVSNIAENGVFIYDADDTDTANAWDRVDNLNSVALTTKCFKFGFDSINLTPYVQFPTDIGELIDEGIIIAYVTTNGINGNIKEKTLTTFSLPDGWSSSDTSSNNSTGLTHTVDEFGCINSSAATNGTDRESLTSAYNNFKKTVGTFDTLVTCRDYMNKIYSLMKSDNSATNLVSNIIVSDIRDDINKSITICSFNEYGINYLDNALTETTEAEITGKDSAGEEHTITTTVEKDLISHFDLMLYPFNTVYNLGTKDDYDKSFKFDKTVHETIKTDLQDIKTISHNFKEPTIATNYSETSTDNKKVFKSNISDIVLIKNYLQLNARITTTQKINEIEQKDIRKNIKLKIYEEFNLHNLDFSEEIPFDSILEVIQNADTRIKNVALEEPTLYTRFLLADNSEYDTAIAFPTKPDGLTDEAFIKTDNFRKYEAKIMNSMCATEKNEYTSTFKGNVTESDDTGNCISYLTARNLQTKTLYNKLALRNIIAGRIAMFNYDDNFTPEVTESQYSYSYTDGTVVTKTIPLVYPTDSSTQIKYISPQLQIKNIPQSTSNDGNAITLKENQIVQFRAPTYATNTTYSTYTNYSLILTGEGTAAKPAHFLSLRNYMCDYIGTAGLQNKNLVSVPHGTLTEDGKETLSNYEEFTESTTTDGEYDNYKNFFEYCLNNSNNNIIKTIKLRAETTAEREAARSSLSAITSKLEISFWYCADIDDITQWTDQTKLKWAKISTNTPIPAAPTKEEPEGEWIANHSGVYAYIPLNEETYHVWYTWIKSQPYYTDSTLKLTGIYKQWASDESRVPGYLIDNNLNKYSLMTSFVSKASYPIDYCFVQYTTNSTTANTVQNGDENSQTDAIVSTSDGLGADAINTEISADTDYTLKENEYLYINYTQAENDVDTTNTTNASLTTTTTQIDLRYGEGTTIRPNFNMQDSIKMHDSGSVYAKTDGYDFSKYLSSDQQQKLVIPGMFSLGSDKQIELRDRKTTKIYNNSNGIVKVYFKLNVETANDKGYIVFLDSGENGKDNYPERILEDGEYFWYLNQNDTILSYCGAGCKIINKSGQAISKSASDSEITVAKINELGINAVDNWIVLSNLYFYDKSATDKYVEWEEYQFITLTAGDSIKCAYLGTSNNSDAVTDDNTTINQNWTKVNRIDGNNKTVYILNDEETTLPNLATYTSSTSTDKTKTYNYDYWEVRSYLNISTGPNNAQTLHNSDYWADTATSADDDGTAPACCRETVRFFKEKPTNSWPESTDTDYEKCIAILGREKANAEHIQDGVAFKTNYSISSTQDLISLDTTVDMIDDDLVETQYLYEDFKVKAFKQNEFAITKITTSGTKETSITEAQTLYNTSDYFTTLSFKEATIEPESSETEPPTEPTAYTTLHCAIDNNYNSPQYGLLMIYYKTDNTNVTDNVYIRFKDTAGSYASVIPKIFNNWNTNKTDFIWWSGNYCEEKTYTKKTSSNDTIKYNNYHLKANSVNVIQICDSADIEIYCGKKQSDSIIFSPLSLVNENLSGAASTESLYIKSAKVLNEKEIQLEFSEPVRLKYFNKYGFSKAWVSIRYLDSSGNLMSGSGHRKNTKIAQAQWNLDLRECKSGASNILIATIPEHSSNRTDYWGTSDSNRDTLTEVLNKSLYDDVSSVKLCIEGTKFENGDYKYDGTVISDYKIYDTLIGASESGAATDHYYRNINDTIPEFYDPKSYIEEIGAYFSQKRLYATKSHEVKQGTSRFTDEKYKYPGIYDDVYIDITNSDYTESTVAGQKMSDKAFTSATPIMPITNLDFGINLDLLQYYNIDQTVDTSSSMLFTEEHLRAKQLLLDINAVDKDHAFFYNTTIDNSTALDVNTYAGETLFTPRIYYNYNNKNNKFVVSEIDSNFLDSGLQFTSSSTKYN